MPLYKKILCFGLLLLVVAPLFIFTAYNIKQKIVQLQMQEALEQNNVQTIVIDKDALLLVNGNKEVIINGNLFDVKSYEKVNDKIILTGLFDTRETEIINQVEKLQQQKSKSKIPIDNLVLKFLFSAAVLPTNLCIPIFKLQNENKFYSYAVFLQLQSKVVDNPPPIV